MSSIIFLEKKLRVDKLGILYLSAVLKQRGHSVDMIQDDIDNAEEYLKKNHVDFICYSVMTSEAPWFFKRNRELKKKFKYVSIFGGPHFTYYPGEGVDDKDVDFIVRGPGELVIAEIVENKIKDKVTMGVIPDLSKMPHPDRTILYKYDYFGKAGIKRFICSRDCYHSCKFCASKRYREIFKDQACNFFQITDVERILDEIEKIRKLYKLEFVYMNDDDLAGHRKWFKEFLVKYKERINLPWGCEIRASSVNYDTIKAMAKANCKTVFIGLESSNTNTLKLLGRTVSARQVRDVAFACSRNGIRVSLENMIGLPVKDPLKDALETLEFNMDLPQVHSWCAIYQPFPQTELWQYCLDEGFLEKQEYARFVPFEDTSILNIPNKEELSRLQKWWYYIVKFKLPMKYVEVLLKTPLKKEFVEKLNKRRYQMAYEELYCA